MSPYSQFSSLIELVFIDQDLIKSILQDTDGEASYISRDEFIGPTSSSNLTQQTS